MNCPKCGKVLPNGAVFCSGCGSDLAQALKDKEKEQFVQTVQSRGESGYYEYKFVLDTDGSDGRLSGADFLEKKFNNMALEGWRLVTAYSNTIGVTSHSGGAFGFSSGTNATIDQNIFVFERFVKL